MFKHLSRSIFAKLPIITGTFIGLSLMASLPLTASATDFANNNYSVQMNRTQILRLPTAAATVVVGNPDIADISVHSADTLFIIGRGYGQTNIIALDALGQTILDANIIVNAPISASSLRIVNIGSGQKSYNCAPYCLPAPILGDTQNFIAKFSGHAVNIRGGGSGPVANPGNTPVGQLQNALSATSSNPVSGPPSSRGQAREAGRNQNR